MPSSGIVLKGHCVSLRAIWDAGAASAAANNAQATILRAALHEARLALVNVHTLARRLGNTPDAASHLLRFCAQGGVVESEMDFLRSKDKDDV